MPAVTVSQPVLSKRLLSFPAELFQQIFYSLLFKLCKHWQARQRPLPESVRYPLHHFEHLWIFDFGFYDFAFFDALIERSSHYYAFEVQCCFQRPDRILPHGRPRDRLIELDGAIVLANIPCT